MCEFSNMGGLAGITIQISSKLKAKKIPDESKNNHVARKFKASRGREEMDESGYGLSR